jgi:hypothetical protein
MNPEQREIFRDTILRSFRHMRGGMNLATLRVVLRSCGFDHFEDEDALADIQYFLDAKFLAEVPKSHSIGLKIWRITKDGVDDLEKRHL